MLARPQNGHWVSLIFRKFGSGGRGVPVSAYPHEIMLKLFRIPARRRRCAQNRAVLCAHVQQEVHKIICVIGFTDSSGAN